MSITSGRVVAAVFLAAGATLPQPSPAVGINAAVVPVSAIVQPSAQVRFEVVPINISITSADIARGYIDVPIGSLLSIKSGQPLPPVIVDFSMGDGVFKSVEVRGRESASVEEVENARRTDLDSSAAAEKNDPGYSQIDKRKKTGEPPENASSRYGSSTALAYRFRLSEKARPGSYQIPLVVNVTF